jgi:ankyrin repeat protein
MFKSILKKKSPESLRSGDLEGALPNSPDNMSSNAPETNNDPGPGTKRSGRPVVVIRNLDAPAPSLTFNVRSQLNRGELYLVAVLGTVLQLGVLIFSGCATYHPDLRSRWLKDDNPAADYAFACNAGGTLLLVAGMLICAHVVEGSTSETRYRPVEGEARVVWLQKSGTVNDQAFESFAIFPRQPLTLITTSQRWDAGGSQQPILGETIAVIGTTVGLCGFVAQFVGLRGLHWSSSIAQLIAIGFMVVLRAWVRRNLAQLPAARRLLSGHEMDWLAMTLADDLAKAPWLNPPKDGGDPQAGTEGDGSQKDGQLDRQSRPWDWKPTAVENPATLLALQEADGSESPSETRAQMTMMLRRDLGEVADWQGPASAEAIALARAIEIAMDTLFDTKPNVNGKLTWHLSVPSSPEDSRSESVTFRVEQLATGHWKAFSDELEAALSLWLYSVAELDHTPGNDLADDDEHIKPGDNRRTNEGGRLEIKPMRSKDDTWLRIKGEQAKRSLRLLGQSTESLNRDLRWWIPRLDNTTVTEVRMDGKQTNSGDTIEVDNYRIVGCASNWGPGSYIHRNSNHEDASTASGDDRPAWTTAAESSIPLATLFAQHMFTSFMWAAAKKMKSHIPGGADILPSERDSALSTWTSFALRNAKLHKMAQDIQGTGLGSLGDVYLALIPPLSVERKLPQPDAIIELARKNANPHGQPRQWSNVADAYLWLIRAVKGLQEDILTRAAALLIDHLRAIIDTIELLESQHIDESGIQQLKEDRDRITKALRGVDNGVLAFLLGLYRLQGRPWNGPLPEWPQPLKTSALVPKLKDLHVHMWVLGHSNESHTSDLLHGMGNSRRWDEKDILDWAPLFYTIMKSLDNKRDRCLHQGADVNARDFRGRTPLHYACQRGFTSSILSLLRAGAEMNARDADGLVPLHNAARSGSGELVRQLIEAGAEVNVVDGFGNTPLHHAAYAGSPAALMGCLEYANVKLRDHNGRTALHLAVIGGKGSVEERKAVIKALMEKAGIDKEAKDYDDWTPLQLAARFGNAGAVEVLGEMGADKEVKDNWRYTPLHYAVRYGHEAVVQVLVEQGVDKEANDFYNDRPLHDAARYGNMVVVKFLVERGADKDAKNNKGNSPLHLAAESGWEGVVKFLVEQGADKEAKNDSGNTPLNLALEKKHEATIEVLIQMGADTGAKDSDGNTPLHCAAKLGHLDLVKFLVERGADKDAKNNSGNTPLHYAADGETIFRFLVNQGADQEIKNDDGETPFEAYWRYNKDALDMLGGWLD